VLPALLGADLAPQSPSGWSGPIVVSTTAGTNTDAASFVTGQPIYVDYAAANAGDTAAGSFLLRLSLDGQTVSSRTVTSLAPGATFQILDDALGALSSGTHTLTVTVDANGAISETDESNNVATKTFTISAAGGDGGGSGGTAGDFLIANFNSDNVPDLVFIKKSATVSGRTELQILSGATNYQTLLQNVAANLRQTGSETEFQMADFNRDGVPDLAYVRKSGTGSGMSELHVLSGAGGFQTFLAHVALPLPATGDEADFLVGDFNGDSVLDLAYVKKFNTGSGRTELHVLSGATNYQTWIRHTALPLAETGDESVFRVGDFNADRVLDLADVKKSSTGSGRTELHVLSGATGFQAWISHTATALVETGGEAEFDLTDYDTDGRPDLGYVKKFNTGSARTELHILDGGSEYQSFLLHTATALPPILPPAGSSAGPISVVASRILSQTPVEEHADSSTVGNRREDRVDETHSRRRRDALDALFTDLDQLSEALEATHSA
jgi:hypothetical protein